MLDTAIILLAAGSSSRIGRPKQLLDFKGQTLIQRIVDAAVGTGAPLVVVVTGSVSKEVVENLEGRDVVFAFNSQWMDGMASGIVVGLEKVLFCSPNIENVILVVCDQPFVTSDFLSKLLFLKNKSKKTIVSSAYGNTVGTPVLFNRKHFSALLGLRGTEGAKKLLKLLKDDMVTLPLENGEVDIDTEADYIKLIND